jgi:hypothetical protein
MFDGKAFGVEIVGMVRDYVDAQTAPLHARIAELEARQPERGEKGDPGEAGVNGRDGLDGEVGPAGEPGLAGKDAEPLTREQLVDAILAMPEVLDEAVRRHIEANPPADGKDGRDGVDGAHGEKGDPGSDGSDGKDGSDGVGVAGAFKDHDGALILTLTNGETRNLGQIEGKNGRDGIDGRNGADGAQGPAGFSLEAFDAALKDDGRTLLLKFSADGMTATHEIQMPVVIDRGVYKADADYLQGDAVTWGGSIFIAQRDTSAKPEASDDWRLAVKRGRDGKPGKDGDRGEPGQKGDPGRDGRNWG